MRRTSPGVLALLAFIVAVSTWTLETWLVSSGRAMFTPPITLAITLVVLAIVLLVLAWPIRRYTGELGSTPREGRATDATEEEHAERSDAEQRRAEAAGRRRVDPQHAVRVLALAKASSLTASVLGGLAFAVVVFVVTRPVVATGSTVDALAALVGAIVLLVAGLLAESWCALPPDDGAHGTRPQRAAPTA